MESGLLLCIILLICVQIFFGIGLFDNSDEILKKVLEELREIKEILRKEN
jgi:hypothetical protein